MFRELKEKVRFKFDQMAEGELFTVTVDRDLIWSAYIDGFSDETRQGHNCHCCKSFLRQWGNIVTIVDQRVVSIWDIEEVPVEFQQSVKNLSDYIHSLDITDVFRNDFVKLGTDFNFESTESTPIRWEHFYVQAPARFMVAPAAVDSTKAVFRDNYSVLKSSLEKLTPAAVDTVLELIAQNSLYRGKEFESAVRSYQKIQILYEDARDKDLFCWRQSLSVPQSISRIKNTSIGTLLVNLSEGMELDAAVGAFERMVAPTNYKRPTALITGKMIEEAQKRILELGLDGALNRRYAVETDISVNDILFVDKSSNLRDVFADMKQDVKVNPRTLSKVEEITISDFIENVLPKATALHAMVENHHLNNFVSLLAPIESDVNKLFKWDNNFSWSYTNGVTDSIKERVKQAGGRVEGELRVSLSWSNYDDLDLHINEPAPGSHIFFNNKVSGTSGHLDVDMNAGGLRSREPVENVIWTNKSRMIDGVYKVHVNQYSKRENIDRGYVVEIEHNGQIYTFESKDSPLATDLVCEFNYSKSTGVTFISGNQSAGTVISKEKWGVNTNQFTKVKMMSLSPNFWNGQIGNKHFIFILDKCISDEAPRPFFNEFLREELQKDRKVFEVMGSKIKVEPSSNQLSGVGFSDTQKDHLFVKVEGNFSRTLKVVF